MAAVSIGQAWAAIWEAGVWALIWDQGSATLTAVTVFPGSSHVGVRVTTDVGFGTIYGVLTESAVAPTGAQVKAGQDENGAAAVDADSIAVVAAGDHNLDFTAVPETSGYYVHLVHETVGFSGVVSSSTFATGASSGIGGSGGVRFIYDFSVRF